MAKPPASEQVQVNFRMPADLRDQIKARAETAGRSMNAEIVFALERYIALEGIDIFDKPFTPESTDMVLSDSDMVAKGVRAARRLLTRLEHAEELADAAKRLKK